MSAPAVIRVTHVLEAALGGTMRHLLHIASLIDTSRFELSFVLSVRRDPVAAGKNVEKLRNMGFEVHLVEMRREPNPRDALSLFALSRALRRLRPDIVHLHAAKAGTLGRMAAAAAGVPRVVYTPHLWSFAWEKSPAKKTFYRAVESALAPMADAVVVLTPDQAAEALSARVAPSSSMTVIPNAADIPPETASPPPPPPFLVGAVGRLVEQKGFDVLLRAAGMLQAEGTDFRLRIAGDGPLAGELRNAVRSLGLGGIVEFCGHVEDVWGFLSPLHLFVMPSRWEGLPYALLDALSCGLPVAASDIAGIRSLVLDGWNGRLVPPDSPRELADAVAELLRSEGKRARFARNSRLMAARHSPRQFIRSLEWLYRSLFERRAVFHA